jgi:para-nitrobenzyl esterase
VNVEQGIIEGEFDVRNSIQSYKGIPFAKPPVGDLRWKAPQAPDKWSGVRQTKI